MKLIRSSPLAVPFAMVALVIAPGTAVAKCAPPKVGVERLPVAYMIDGKVVDEEAFNSMDPGEIIEVRIICHDVQDPVSGTIVQDQPVVWVLTSFGIEDALKVVLDNVSAAQESFHAREGRFAKGSELPRFPWRTNDDESPYVVATATGWSATIGYYGSAERTICHIAFGSIDLPHPQLTLGVPACFPMEQSPAD